YRVCRVTPARSARRAYVSPVTPTSGSSSRATARIRTRVRWTRGLLRAGWRRWTGGLDGMWPILLRNHTPCVIHVTPRRLHVSYDVCDTPEGQSHALDDF